MLITGCDFHCRFQQVAMVDTETGELIERRLEHGDGGRRSFTPNHTNPCEYLTVTNRDSPEIPVSGQQPS